MNIKPIKSEADLDAALTRIDELFDAAPNTLEADELELLSLLVEHYEDQHYPIAEPDPIEFIKSTMTFLGMKQKDLAKLLQSESRASELLNRKRALNLEQIRTLHAAWKIPVEPLIQQYDLAR